MDHSGIENHKSTNIGGYMLNFTDRELWTLVHGMGFGALYLLAFAGGVAGLYSMRPEFLTTAGIKERAVRLRWGAVAMAALVWLTVIVGTYIVYPQYRAKPPTNIDTTVQSAELREYPRSWLKAGEETAPLHEFGMEWKEHVTWIAPILATIVAYAIFRYREELAQNPQARWMIVAFFILSFVIAGIGGALGAVITKTAPLL
jgi:uncharacterized membrane protein